MAYRGNPAMPRARRRSPRPPCPPHAPPLGWGALRPANGLRRGRSHGLNGLIWRFKALSAPFRHWGGMALHAGRETSIFLILGTFPQNARGFGRRVVRPEGRRLESPAFGGKSRHLRTAPPHGASRGTDTPRRTTPRPQPPRSHPLCTPFAPPSLAGPNFTPPCRAPSAFQPRRGHTPPPPRWETVGGVCNVIATLRQRIGLVEYR